MPYPISTLDPTRFAGISRALQNASDKTGTGFDHLVNTAMRESALNPKAKASTSSASGMFQFIEQTWLSMVKQHGAEHGLVEQADAIVKDARGRYIVPDPATRKEILALRKDTDISALMAGELTNDNRKILENRLDRGVDGGELYAAHVLGAHGAVKLIRAAEQNPTANAANLFPSAARANHGIFYEKSHARSVAEVADFLASKAKGPAVELLYAANTPSNKPSTPASSDFASIGLPSLPPATASFAATGNSLAGLGHNSRILGTEMIAIMASLDMPGVGGSESGRKNRNEAGSFGLIG